MTSAPPAAAETEILQCIAGPLCGRKFRIRKSARGLAMNATMVARLKRDAKREGIGYRHGVYMKEIWRKGKKVLLWTELPAAGLFNQAKN